MKKVLSLLLAVCLVLSLTACANDTDNTDDKMQDLFKEYLSTNVSNDEHRAYIEIDNLNLFVSMTNVEIEKKEGEYRIIADMGYVSDEGEIFNNPLQDLKYEMNQFAEYFITFAKQQELDNDYYLYVTCYCENALEFVYDYEEDRLYYSKHYDDFLKMYNKFGSIDFDAVASTENGKNWLVENGFGETKHHEFERYSWTITHPSVYIYEGEFYSRDLDEYI